MNLLVSSQENLINFWESDAWGFITIIAVLVCSLIVANVLKKSVKFLEKSLIPTSVLGGMILLIISFVYTVIKGQNPDGTWSHKQGNAIPTDRDCSNDLILDPQTADKYFSADQNYQFVGYYRVTPLTSYAEESD